MWTPSSPCPWARRSGEPLPPGSGDGSIPSTGNPPSTAGLTSEAIPAPRSLPRRAALLSPAATTTGTATLSSWTTRGQGLGLVGNSGRSTGAHLHYEIKYRDKLIDPVKFIQVHSRTAAL
ncbi:MAG: hypothetical protein CVU68_04720 [Deltaproteobacteria bacterium HGW-Deltaproteobacteria-3]|nr:MAG: hypothetical protein CVU68_04720 [Deltaproteobacteria bacterium HGW-Deltaproteobacteria-3]